MTYKINIIMMPFSPFIRYSKNYLLTLQTSNFSDLYTWAYIHTYSHTHTIVIHFPKTQTWHFFIICFLMLHHLCCIFLSMSTGLFTFPALGQKFQFEAILCWHRCSVGLADWLRQYLTAKMAMTL